MALSRREDNFFPSSRRRNDYDLSSFVDAEEFTDSTYKEKLKYVFDKICDTNNVALIIGSAFLILDFFGIQICIVLLVNRISDPELPDKYSLRICTSLLFWTLCRSLGASISGILVQMLGSSISFVVNLLLIIGLWKRKPTLLLIWLVFYVFIILCCVHLFGWMFNTLWIRQQVKHDVALSTMLLVLVPLFLVVTHTFLWTVILKQWRRINNITKKPIFCIA
uniref:Uncharacterized protein n=1 Tax=Lepeophtheirus salmonis TaxID=72036 RepID=A0A0K2URF2_LEPSM